MIGYRMEEVRSHRAIKTSSNGVKRLRSTQPMNEGHFWALARCFDQWDEASSRAKRGNECYKGKSSCKGGGGGGWRGNDASVPERSEGTKWKFPWRELSLRKMLAKSPYASEKSKKRVFTLLSMMLQATMDKVKRRNDVLWHLFLLNHCDCRYIFHDSCRMTQVNATISSAKPQPTACGWGVGR